MQTRYVEMYSLCRWEKPLRKQFCLGYDPYFFAQSREGAAALRARELLASLGVFYYRDTENSKGILLQPTVGKAFERITGKECVFDPPLECYFSTVNVLYPAIVPIDYPVPTNIANSEKYLEYKEKWGDTKQWLRWCVPTTISQISSKMVRQVPKKKDGIQHGQETIT